MPQHNIEKNVTMLYIFGFLGFNLCFPCWSSE